MDKKEVVEVLETILDGLTSGDSSEKKLEEVKKSYADELNKVNIEKQFYERVIRFCLFERYGSTIVSALGRHDLLDGSKLFLHQSQANATYGNEHRPGLAVSPEDFNKFVDEYLAAARNDRAIGIKEEINV